jgi:hypothetical protein
MRRMVSFVTKAVEIARVAGQSVAMFMDRLTIGGACGGLSAEHIIATLITQNGGPHMSCINHSGVGVLPPKTAHDLQGNGCVFSDLLERVPTAVSAKLQHSTEIQQRSLICDATLYELGMCIKHKIHCPISVVDVDITSIPVTDTTRLCTGDHQHSVLRASAPWMLTRCVAPA